MHFPPEKTNIKYTRLSGLNFFAILAILIAMAAGCSKGDDSSAGSSSGGTSFIDSTFVSGTAEGSVEVGYNADDMIENSTFSSSVLINFGTSVTITNPLSAGGVTISQS